MTSPLTLVDAYLEPRIIYTILDALYDDTFNKPEDNMEAIDYLEGRLMDLDLPLNRESYESETHSPENNVWKSVSIFQVPEEV